MPESMPEKVEEQAQPPQTKPGDAPAPEVGKLRPICTLAEENYQSMQGLIKKIREAELIRQRFKAGQENITAEHLEAAKTQFDASRQSYIQLGNQINDGIRPVHALAKVYVEDQLVQNLYKTYLAKLLCSLETRHPVEPFVRGLGEDGFHFDRDDLALTQEEERRGLTVERKRANLRSESVLTIVMLETRYQKRLLQNRLRQGDNPVNIIRRLHFLLSQDPADLHTYIWLAQLMVRELAKERNQNSRVALRDDILNVCKRGFALIDDFLNLQGIQTLTDRDKRRSEYVKTITAIRNPLVRKEG